MLSDPPRIGKTDDDFQIPEYNPLKTKEEEQKPSNPKQLSLQKPPEITEKTNENNNISQTNSEKKLLDDLNFSQQPQPQKLEKSLFFLKKPRPTESLLDHSSKKVQRNFYIYLIGSNKSEGEGEETAKLPISLSRFLFQLIPETYTARFNEFYPEKEPLNEDLVDEMKLDSDLPFLHSFSKEFQATFLINLEYDTHKRLNAEAMIWFCTQNNKESLAFLQKHSYSAKENSICVVVFQPSSEKTQDPDFQEKLAAFCKTQQTSYLNFPLENPSKSFEKLLKIIQNYIEKLIKLEKDAIQRIKEPPLTTSNKLDPFLIKDLACFLVQNQGLIPQEKLEKRVFLLLGRPNDLQFSQYKRVLEPYIEKFKAIFQKSFEENFKKTHKQRLLRPAARNPLALAEDNRLVLTESEAKDLVSLALEHAVLSKTLKNRKKIKENCNKTVSLDSKLRGFLGFPSKNDFLEIKQFIEKEVAKKLDNYAENYEKTLQQRHKSAKPKVFYKSFDFLKRDFHGIEVSKQICKEKLDSFADFLVKTKGNCTFSSADLRVFTGFIGLKEFKHLEKRIERKQQEINEMRNKQRFSCSLVEENKEKSAQNLIKCNVFKKNFEKWTLIYLKNCKESQAAVAQLREKSVRKLKKFNKIVEIVPVELEETATSLTKLRKLSRVLLLVAGNKQENVENMRKFLERQLLAPKKSHSLEKLQVLLLFFSETAENSAVFEEFEAWVHENYISEKKLNIFLQEEPYFSLQTYFQHQVFSRFQSYFEKLSQKSADPQIPQPDIQGILLRKDAISSNNAFSYENFIEILSQRLFPGEGLDKELMDELFLNFFKKNAGKFETLDFNQLYFKALKKLNRLIAQTQEKVAKFEQVQRDLQVSLKKNDAEYSQDEFLAVRVAEIRGFAEINATNSKRKGAAAEEHFLEAQYGEQRHFSGKFSLKDAKINEKFLIPLQETHDFSIKLCNIDEKSQFNGLLFTLSLRDLAGTEAFPLGKLLEATISCGNIESFPELSARKTKEISLEVKFKRLIYNKEKTLLKLNKISSNLQGFRDHLSHLLRCKYEVLEVFGPKAQENADFLKGNFDFLQNLDAKETKIDASLYDNEINLIREELETQRKLIESLENARKSEEIAKTSMESELKKLTEKLQEMKEDARDEKSRLSEEIRAKTAQFSQFSQTQALNLKKLEVLSASVKDFSEKLQKKEFLKKQFCDKRQEIVDFFTAGQNSGHSPENLRKLQEYFLYVQKAILKFYNKAVIIEADVFEMKSSAIKSGLGALAGSVPFIGNMLKFLVETAVDLKKAWDERKFMRKCIKFSSLVHSQRILAEIVEHAAFETIKNSKKQELILQASDIKSSVMEKLKEKIIEFFKKAKDFFTRKKKSKTQEKLLKDLDTPAKLLGNIDGGFLCTQAVELYKQEYLQFDPQDPYNKAGLEKLFAEILANIDHKMYEKVIGFEEMKDFSAVTLLEVENKAQEIEPSHDELVSVVLELEDPVFARKLEENSDEIEVLREKQQKNERKLQELAEQHDLQNGTLENHEKRLVILEKHAVSALNFLGGLNQEIHDLNERVENLYSSMNVRYEEILKKLENNEEVPANLIKPAQKQNSLSEQSKNDPFFMYLQKSVSNSSKSLKSSVGTPNKPVLTPLGKKS